MARRFLFIGAAVLVVLLVPAGAQAATDGERGSATRECQEDRLDEPSEFERRYGGTDSQALRRCARFEVRDAYRDCRAERRFEPGEYRREYGGGERALHRCVIDELDGPGRNGAGRGEPDGRGGLGALARADCEQEQREDPREFSFEHGGSDRSAISRCADQQRREARFDCEQERRFEPREYQREYGSGGDAMSRCVRDEIR